jgi:hypothetical protein
VFFLNARYNRLVIDKTLFTVYGTHHNLRLKRSITESSSKLLLLFSTQWRVSWWRRMSIVGDEVVRRWCTFGLLGYRALLWGKAKIPQMIVAGVLKERKNPSPLHVLLFFFSLSSFLSRPLLFIGLNLGRNFILIFLGWWSCMKMIIVLNLLCVWWDENTNSPAYSF